VRGPEPGELGMMKRGGIVVGLLNPWDAAALEGLAQTGTTGFAMEWLPRTSRAQAMDVLSSQANIAGYKAVIIAANEYGRFMPQLMTAAGTVKAARVVILGAGVAGLQAIATAKRLGAVIEASDVRPAVKEKIESLGAKFIDVPFETDEEREIAKGVGGYARPMPKSWLDRQQAEVAKRIAAANIVISTAQIPGRKAPVLVTDAMVKSMKPGSVIVDLAVETGGNVEGVELGKVVVKHGAKIVGLPNLAGLLPADASALYARNLLNFMNLLVDPKSGELKLNRDDDIIAGALACIDGAVVKKG
jgi:NAD(P) transhydrogenase subunit alpha